MFNEDVLDFIKIKEELANHCSSIIAKEMALALEPMMNREKIQEALDETAEALRSWQTEIEQPLGGTRDIRESCKKSRKDFVLSREAIWDVYITIGAYKRMVKFKIHRISIIVLMDARHAEHGPRGTTVKTRI